MKWIIYEQTLKSLVYCPGLGSGDETQDCSAGIPRKTWYSHLVISFTASWSSFSLLRFRWPSLLSNKKPVPNYLRRFATDFVVLWLSHSWPCIVRLMQSLRCCSPRNVPKSFLPSPLNLGHFSLNHPQNSAFPHSAGRNFCLLLTLLSVTSGNFTCCHGLTSSSFPQPVQLI